MIIQLSHMTTKCPDALLYEMVTQQNSLLITTENVKKKCTLSHLSPQNCFIIPFWGGEKGKPLRVCEERGCTEISQRSSGGVCHFSWGLEYPQPVTWTTWGHKVNILWPKRVVFLYKDCSAVWAAPGCSQDSCPAGQLWPQHLHRAQ